MNTEYLRVNYENNKAKAECVFEGKTYRITILTERLVRLEYSKTGDFFDDLTEQVVNRNFPIPKFDVKEDDKYLEINTSYFLLKYHKEKPFEGFNIEIVLKKEDGTSAPNPWNIRSKEVRNFKASGRGIVEDKMDFIKGLYSTDGYVTIDDSKSLIINSDGFLSNNDIPRIDLYVLTYRRSFGYALSDYFQLTGYPPLIPRYALGIWWNKNEIYNFQDIEHIVNNFNKYNIPLSVILLDEFWHLKDSRDLSLYHTGFTFNRNLFSDPNNLTKYLHERGIKLGLMIDPTEGIYPHEDRYQNVINKLGVNGNNIIPFNVFDKKIIETYFNDIIKYLDDFGIDFYALDYRNMGEVERRVLTNYHFKYSDYKREKRGMLLAPNTFVASHRQGILFSHYEDVSWNTLNNNPYFNLMGSNKGLSWWSHDIGGYYHGIEEDELYLRWIELATFSPIFRLSSKGGKYFKREPWAWDVKTLKIVSDYTILRQRLIPYLYSENYKYHKTGLPLIEPLYYTNPSIYDEPIYKNEYYFGSELLVCPITEKKDYLMNRTLKRIYLPKGTWYELKTGKRFIGDKRYVVFYRDEDYPVFAKSGSIIPLANLEKNKNVTDSPKDMEIVIFPGKSNIYNLYEDDGYSNLYKEGYYLLSAIDYNYLKNNYTVIIHPVSGKNGIITPTRNYKIRFKNTRKAKDVLVYLNQDIYSYDSYVDDTDFIVEINDVPTSKQLSINCKGKDIEIDSLRLINEDIDSIISDLQIKTTLKDMIANIIFSDMPFAKKRIALRKLKRNGLESKFIKMFLKLIEYAEEV